MMATALRAGAAGAAAAGLALAGLAAAPVAAQEPDGASLFKGNCSACHGSDGSGIPPQFPALDGNEFVTGDIEDVTRVILSGRAGMPAFQGDLSNAELAAVITFIRNAWSNDAVGLAAQDVARIAEGSSPRPRMEREN